MSIHTNAEDVQPVLRTRHGLHRTEITLWSQQGSQVLRGNLLVIPLEDAVLYVQPLYIQAQNNPLPELKRVIVASTSAVVMSDRLDTALTALGQGRSGEILSGNNPNRRRQVRLLAQLQARAI